MFILRFYCTFLLSAIQPQSTARCAPKVTIVIGRGAQNVRSATKERTPVPTDPLFASLALPDPSAMRLSAVAVQAVGQALLSLNVAARTAPFAQLGPSLSSTPPTAPPVLPERSAISWDVQSATHVRLGWRDLLLTAARTALQVPTDQ
jgi:hypothetical protein